MVHVHLYFGFFYQLMGQSSGRLIESKTNQMDNKYNSSNFKNIIKKIQRAWSKGGKINIRTTTIIQDKTKKIG